MQGIERTPIAPGDAFTLADVKAHLRVFDSADDTTIEAMARAAVVEIEAYANLALLTQSITFTATAHEQRDGLTTLRLPIGPNPDNITVERIEQDGTLTPSPNSWVVFNGALMFATHPEWPMRITYEAGYGADADAIPADVAHALADVTARLYDMRGVDDGPATFPPAAARIMARHRRVRL